MTTSIKKCRNVIAYTSDLHCAVFSPHQHEKDRVMTNLDEISDMCNSLRYQLDSQGLNLVGLAVLGDIGENFVEIGFALGRLTEEFPNIPKIACWGNHDLYCYRDPFESEEKMRHLPGLFKENGFGCLDAGDTLSFDDGKVQLIGNTGWCDLEALNHTHSSLPPAHWNHIKRSIKGITDSWAIKWERDDISYAKECRDKLQSQLDQLEGDPMVEQVIVVTHVPPFYREYKNPKTNFRHDPFLDMFFYHPSLGPLLLSYSKVRHIISGHTHLGVSITKQNSAGKNVNCQVIPSDYRRPSYLLTSACASE